jgi:hypothetical protein
MVPSYKAKATSPILSVYGEINDHYKIGRIQIYSGEEDLI